MEASAFRFKRVDSSEPLFWKHGLLVSYNIIKAVNCCEKALLLTYCVKVWRWRQGDRGTGRVTAKKNKAQLVLSGSRPQYY